MMAELVVVKQRRLSEIREGADEVPLLPFPVDLQVGASKAVRVAK
jgi:hypothetical protein